MKVLISQTNTGSGSHKWAGKQILKQLDLSHFKKVINANTLKYISINKPLYNYMTFFSQKTTDIFLPTEI
jgi:hypothetical protein